MPEYTFQIVIIVIRDDTELSLIKNSHSLYETAIMQTVYYHAKPFIDVGYRLHRYYTQNYEFLTDQKQEEHG